MAKKGGDWSLSNQSSCGDKKIYYSYAGALKANKKLKRKLQFSPRENLHPYRCENCGLFHLGHAKRTREKKYFKRARFDFRQLPPQ